MTTTPQPNQPTTKRPNHYVDNQAFLAALIDYKKQIDAAKEAGKEIPQISNYIGECFIKIATHLSYAKNFINYSYKDEMVSDAIENCLKCVTNFDPQFAHPEGKPINPFAYFTQVSWYAFIRRIQKEQKETKIKNAILHNIDFDAIISQNHDAGEFNDQYLDYIRKQIEFLDSKK